MTRRSKVWLVVATLFTSVNFAGGVMAALQGEALHSGAHVGLMLLGAFVVWRLVPRRYDPSSELADRLTHLEQAIDAIAIEVERIGEGQRFITRLFTEDRTPRAPGEGAAEPVEIKLREAAQHDGR